MQGELAQFVVYQYVYFQKQETNLILILYEPSTPSPIGLKSWVCQSCRYLMLLSSTYTFISSQRISIFCTPFNFKTHPKSLLVWNLYSNWSPMPFFHASHPNLTMQWSGQVYDWLMCPNLTMQWSGQVYDWLLCYTQLVTLDNLVTRITIYMAQHTRLVATTYQDFLVSYTWPLTFTLLAPIPNQAARYFASLTFSTELHQIYLLIVNQSTLLIRTVHPQIYLYTLITSGQILAHFGTRHRRA